MLSATWQYHQVACKPRSQDPVVTQPRSLRLLGLQLLEPRGNQCWVSLPPRPWSQLPLLIDSPFRPAMAEPTGWHGSGVAFLLIRKEASKPPAALHHEGDQGGLPSHPVTLALSAGVSFFPHRGAEALPACPAPHEGSQDG